MTATIKNRNTAQLAGLGSLPAEIAVKNDEVLYAGSIIAVDATPEIVNAADTSALVVVGRCPIGIDNAADGETLSPEMGCFLYENDGDNAVVAGDKVAYVHDNQTVCATAGSTNKIVAGLMIQVVSDGVWVDQTLAGLRTAQALHDLGDASATAHIADVSTTSTAPVALTEAKLTGSVTGSANGVLEDIAAASGACGGSATPSATDVNTAIATAVAPIVTGLNLQVKELMTEINLVIDDVTLIRGRQVTVVTDINSLTTKVNALIAALEAQNVLKSA